MNFFSDEWREMKGWLTDMIQSELKALENAANEKDADKARGALRALRRLSDKESKATP